MHPLDIALDHVTSTLTLWVVCAIAGWLIGRPRRRARAGAALGLLLGPIGVAIAFALREPYDVAVSNPDRPKY